MHHCKDNWLPVRTCNWNTVETGVNHNRSDKVDFSLRNKHDWKKERQFSTVGCSVLFEQCIFDQCLLFTVNFHLTCLLGKQNLWSFKYRLFSTLIVSFLLYICITSMTKCDPLCSWIFRMVKVVHPYQTLWESILTSGTFRQVLLKELQKQNGFHRTEN